MRRDGDSGMDLGVCREDARCNEFEPIRKPFAMKTIGQSALFSYLSTSPRSVAVNSTQVRKDRGHTVKSYLELATKVAELQFRNRDHVLMFRGQGRDFCNEQRNTSLKATLFRGIEKRNPDAA